MKRLVAIMLLAGCSGGESAVGPSGGAPMTMPEGGRSSGGSAAGAMTMPSSGDSSGGAASPVGGGGSVAVSGGPSEGGSSGSPQGGESAAGTTSAGMGGASGGVPSGGMGGSAGQVSSAGMGGAGGSGGSAGMTSGGSGGSGGSSGCPSAESYVWKVTGATCRCNGQCNRTAAQCAGMEGKSCLNEQSCQADCYKPTPESCGEANTWHVQGTACVCGSCSKSITGCSLGNQCLISTDGMTCKEAC